MSNAWSCRFPVRLSCGHLNTYTGTPPWPGEHVYCLPCEGPSQVALRYYDPARPTGWCGTVSGDGTDQLRCTLGAGHPEGKHLDGPRDTWFTRGAPLRSACSGNLGRCP